MFWYYENGEGGVMKNGEVAVANASERYDVQR